MFNASQWGTIICTGIVADGLHLMSPALSPVGLIVENEKVAHPNAGLWDALYARHQPRLVRTTISESNLTRYGHCTFPCVAGPDCDLGRFSPIRKSRLLAAAPKATLSQYHAMWWNRPSKSGRRPRLAVRFSENICERLSILASRFPTPMQSLHVLLPRLSIEQAAN
ncbi:hypothetical protein JMJ77_0003843 [Colletotrichum scovillei]|uniref:Uncharacterized protein n=1 Tax=Colletotrichum scovillei TaxID=1209932 RepID=A0A9P7U6R9_9PEZI|nr:hypothetical protein JMJ77_0003843 [Colletotrichum scovillei]KAG7049091.1 hypothetical protein JMJ78_0013074 [Colletotrichum scovillei]KAG7063833.1 hypothetical protein JMJ76_0006881 [Colletotrichum scovillei]